MARAVSERTCASSGLTLVTRRHPLLGMAMLRAVFALSLPVLAFSACRPAAPLDAIRGQAPPAPPSHPAVAAVLAPPNPQAPSSPAKAPALTQVFIRGIHFEGASFDARSHRLLVIDQPNGPASTFGTSRDVARQHDALLALNAGFFTPEGDPLGLVISKGNRAGAWNSASSLGSGIFSESASGNLSITRRGSPTAFQGARELIQAGPLLVENGGAVGGLDAGKIAVRSILLTDGGTRWWIGKTSACSLAGLGEALASQSPASWPIQHALNLDGGRSTDLYVSARIPGGSFERRSFLNRPVRNFLILKPK